MPHGRHGAYADERPVTPRYPSTRRSQIPVALQAPTPMTSSPRSSPQQPGPTPPKLRRPRTTTDPEATLQPKPTPTARPPPTATTPRDYLPLPPTRSARPLATSTTLTDNWPRPSKPTSKLSPTPTTLPVRSRLWHTRPPRHPQLATPTTPKVRSPQYQELPASILTSMNPMGS